MGEEEAAGAPAAEGPADCGRAGGCDVVGADGFASRAADADGAAATGADDAWRDAVVLPEALLPADAGGAFVPGVDDALRDAVVLPEALLPAGTPGRDGASAAGADALPSGADALGVDAGRADGAFGGAAGADVGDVRGALLGVLVPDGAPDADVASLGGGGCFVALVRASTFDTSAALALAKEEAAEGRVGCGALAPGAGH